MTTADRNRQRRQKRLAVEAIRDSVADALAKLGLQLAYRDDPTAWVTDAHILALGKAFRARPYCEDCDGTGVECNEDEDGELQDAPGLSRSCDSCAGTG